MVILDIIISKEGIQIMVSKGTKAIIGLIVIVIISLFLAFIVSNIIAFNICGSEDSSCTSRTVFQYFFPAMGLSFLALCGCLGLALLLQKTY